MSQGFISLSYRVNRTILQSDCGQSSLACSLYFINTIYFLFNIGKNVDANAFPKAFSFCKHQGLELLKFFQAIIFLGMVIYFEADSPTFSDKWHFPICLNSESVQLNVRQTQLNLALNWELNERVMKAKVLNMHMYMCSCEWK